MTAPLLFQQLLEGAAGAPLPEWPRFAHDIVVRHYPPGSMVFMQDEAHPYVYAVREGLLKLCYLDIEGTEWVKSFSWQGRSFASIAAFHPGGRTAFLAMALEPSTLERLDYLQMQQRARHDLVWARALHEMTMQFAARKEKRERELLTLSPAMRYARFLAEQPALAQRIPQKDLARHLGVTPVGLNRIAMRLRREAPDAARPMTVER